MTVLCATDLDRTLIYSQAAIERWGGPDEVVAVERYRDRDASFMTVAAAEHLAELSREAVVVAVTTRTVDQLARVRLPGRASRWAIAANGGVLLEDGVPDETWTARVTRRLQDNASLDAMTAHARAACRPEWTTSLRTAESLFVYAVLDLSAISDGFVAEQREQAASLGWTVSLQGRKLYWVPAGLTKSAAVAEVARRCDAPVTIAAGDSLLDADLLAVADEGILARHGELAASGWRADHVCVTEAYGIDAGTEIVRWLAGRSADRVGFAESPGNNQVSFTSRDLGSAQHSPRQLGTTS